MKVIFDPTFLEKLKKVDVRIRKSTKEQLLIFSKDPYAPQLVNHPLRDLYSGYKSIDINADYRALYKERHAGGETVAYFVILGSHDELYS